MGQSMHDPQEHPNGPDWEFPSFSRMTMSLQPLTGAVPAGQSLKGGSRTPAAEQPVHSNLLSRPCLVKKPPENA